MQQQVTVCRMVTVFYGWYITTEYGTPMDYISAKRILESGACLVAEYDTVNDNPILIIQDE